MDNIDRQIERLMSPYKNVRYDACKQLEQAANLPPRAIAALEAASCNPDPAVSRAARRALLAQRRDEAPNESPTKPSSPTPAPSKMPGATRGKDINCISFFIFIVAIMIAVIWSGSWPAVLGVALFVGVAFLIHREIEQSHYDVLSEAWSALAQQAGLSFIPASKSMFGNYGPASVRGQYRGRNISIKKVFEVLEFPFGKYDDDDIYLVFTQISFSVTNPANFSLSVGENVWRPKPVVEGWIASGDKEFDRYFALKGWPREFLQKSVNLIMPRKSLLLQRPPRTIQLTTNPLGSTSWRRPSIELKGSELVCRQHGVLTDVHKQIALLNLLCDMAELAEGMGSKIIGAKNRAKIAEQLTKEVL
jgi:hypothetical protein